MNQRISEIEILRVVAAIVIMLFHMNVLPGGGRLAVEFFAILSGLLMARSVEKKKELGIIQSTRSFITGKIQSFYPELQQYWVFCVSIMLNTPSGSPYHILCAVLSAISFSLE